MAASSKDAMENTAATENGVSETTPLENAVVKTPALRGYPLFRSIRFLIAVIGFLGFVNLYAQRVNMSVALVCMVNHSALYPIHTPSSNNPSSPAKIEECAQDPNATKKKTKDGPFPWNKSIQGQILASFFYGYLVTQVPSGWLAHRYGGTRVFGWSMLVCAIGTILVPFGARLHYGALIALRVIVGVMQGFSWPAMHGVWTHWAPPLERSILIGGTFAGAQIGNVLAMSTSGVLCEYGFDGGWPTIFYVYGIVGVLWVVAWLLLVSDSPSTHRRISPAEREYIEKSLGNRGLSKVSHKIPWLSFATSLPVWGIIGTQVCTLWGVYAFLTNIPTYLSEVLKFDITSGGFLAAVPYIGFWLSITASASMADILRKKNILSTTWTRKLFNSLGAFGPALFLIILVNLGCRQTAAAVVMLVLGVSFSGCLYGAGFIVNHADIAPTYASLLFGITNTFGTVSGIIAPVIIGVMTKNKLRVEWQNFFYLTAGLFVLGGVIYLVLGSGEVQPWGKAPVYANDEIEMDGKGGEKDETQEGLLQSTEKSPKAAVA